jgi:hypothetical protein
LVAGAIHHFVLKEDLFGHARPVEVLKTASYVLEAAALVPQLLAVYLSRSSATITITDEEEDDDQDGAKSGESQQRAMSSTARLHFFLRGLAKGIPAAIFVWESHFARRAAHKSVKSLIRHGMGLITSVLCTQIVGGSASSRVIRMITLPMAVALVLAFMQVLQVQIIDLRQQRKLASLVMKAAPHVLLAEFSAVLLTFLVGGPLAITAVYLVTRESRARRPYGHCTNQNGMHFSPHFA